MAKEAKVAAWLDKYFELWKERGQREVLRVVAVQRTWSRAGSSAVLEMVNSVWGERVC